MSAPVPVGLEVEPDSDGELRMSLLSGGFEPSAVVTSSNTTLTSTRKFTFRHPTAEERSGFQHHRINTDTASSAYQRTDNSPLPSTELSPTLNTTPAPTLGTTPAPTLDTTPGPTLVTTRVAPTSSPHPRQLSSSMSNPPPPKKKKENAQRIFFVTYAQADKVRFPTRESFQKFVVAGFNNCSTGKAKVDRWVVCEEFHANGDPHYHACIRMDGQIRWSQARKWLADNGVNVNISYDHINYVEMYRYAKKSDVGAIESDNHNNLNMISSPRTKYAQRTNHNRCQ